MTDTRILYKIQNVVQVYLNNPIRVSSVEDLKKQNMLDILNYMERTLNISDEILIKYNDKIVEIIIKAMQKRLEQFKVEEEKKNRDQLLPEKLLYSTFFLKSINLNSDDTPLVLEQKYTDKKDMIELKSKKEKDKCIFNINFLEVFQGDTKRIEKTSRIFEYFQNLNYTYNKCQIVFGEKLLETCLISPQDILERMKTDEKYKEQVEIKLMILYGEKINTNNIEPLLDFNNIISRIIQSYQKSYSKRYRELIWNLYLLKIYPSKYKSEVSKQILNIENELINEYKNEEQEKYDDDDDDKEENRKEKLKRIKRFENKEPYDKYQDLWNNKEFGPIVATMIYMAYIHDGLEFDKLVEAWEKMLREIYKIKDTYDKNKENIPLFVYIFLEIKRNVLCYYTSDKYNFVKDFLLYGSCNCECGSYLVFVLSKMFPEKDYNTVYATSPSHAYILLTSKEKQKIYTIETTEVSSKGIVSEYNPLYYPIDYIISSEQILSLQLLVRSVQVRLKEKNKFAKQLNKEITMKMLGINVKDSCERKIINIKNKHKLQNMVPTPFDSDALFMVYSWLKYDIKVVDDKIKSSKIKGIFYVTDNVQKYLKIIIDKDEYNKEEMEKKLRENIKKYEFHCKLKK
jgi:hypothetical protein